MPNAPDPPPHVTITPLRNGKVATDFRCVCGSHWSGGPFPLAIAEKFKASFIEEHGQHTERDADAPNDDDSEVA